ncbi:MAG: hypothetical protein JSR82_01055 [Verrucomicrobia bacterium]|nr:hypothetical protein [Verrucomicrobiota bacterium]
MKSLFLLTVFTLSLGTATLAQAGDLAADNPRRAARRERLKALPQEDRVRLRKAAMAARNDPAFIEARKSGDRKAIRQARLAAMRKADPGIDSILEKVRPARGGRRGQL